MAAKQGMKKERRPVKAASLTLLWDAFSDGVSVAEQRVDDGGHVGDADVAVAIDVSVIDDE